MAKRYNPGLYFWEGKGATSFQHTLADPNAIGAITKYPPKDLMPREGEYDFSLIDNDIATLAGKKLMIGVDLVNFNGAMNPSSLWPAWFYSDAKFGDGGYGGGFYGVYDRATNRGDYPLWTNSEVDQVIRDLYAAIGTEYNDNSAAEMIFYTETAIKKPPIPWAWTTAERKSLYQGVLSAIQSTFTKARAGAWINFTGYPSKELIDWCVDRDIVLGCPDVKLQYDTTPSLHDEDGIYTGMLANANRVPTAPLISGAAMRKSTSGSPLKQWPGDGEAAPRVDVTGADLFEFVTRTGQFDPASGSPHPDINGTGCNAHYLLLSAYGSELRDAITAEVDAHIGGGGTIPPTHVSFVPIGGGGGGGGGGGPALTEITNNDGGFLPGSPWIPIYGEDDSANDLVVVEAEHYARKSVGTGAVAGNEWEAIGSPGADGLSNDEGMHVDVAAGSNGSSSTGPTLEYDIYYATTGVHYLWIHGRAIPSGNSCFVETPDAVVHRFDIPTGTAPGADSWDNLNSVPAVVSFTVATPGVHTIKVHQREDGFKLDKILTTSNASYTPAGIAQAEAIHYHRAPAGGGGDPTVYDFGIQSAYASLEIYLEYPANVGAVTDATFEVYIGGALEASFVIDQTAAGWQSGAALAHTLTDTPAGVLTIEVDDGGTGTYSIADNISIDSTDGVIPGTDSSGISQAVATASVEQIAERLVGVDTSAYSSPAGDWRVPLTRQFSVIRNVQLTPIGQGGQFTYDIVDLQTTVGAGPNIITKIDGVQADLSNVNILIEGL